MSLALHHECTRVPVTALASCGPLLLAAEGPFVRLYSSEDKTFEYLTTTQIFKAQSIHGIASYSETSDHLIVVCWGGKLIRALEIRFSSKSIDAINLSSTIVTSDWIFDLSGGPDHAQDTSIRTAGVCAAVTAHNALLELTIERPDQLVTPNSPPVEISVSELTSSTRSILYSAHLVWDSTDHILIAAGTAFGEIIFWSWTRSPIAGPNARIHHVFLGHEGSIFGVQISKELELLNGEEPRRLLASCSDDRTVRIWDVSIASSNGHATVVADEDLDTQRTRHTGFSNTAFDEDHSGAACVAVGWGHISRVWTVQFLDSSLCALGHFLLSTGEDATSRVWELIRNDSSSSSNAEAVSFDLLQRSTSAYHSGKNIWSVTICRSLLEYPQVVCGAADSKITASPLSYSSNHRNDSVEYNVEDIMTMAQGATDAFSPQETVPTHKSSRQAEFFRSYSFIHGSSFLLTTNSGKVCLGSLDVGSNTSNNSIYNARLIDHIEELSGYSICVGAIALGLGYVAGARGGIYIYQKDGLRLQKIHSVNGKVGSMFTHAKNLLITLLGKKEAQLLDVDSSDVQDVSLSRIIAIPLSELVTGLGTTSMAYINTTEIDYILLGFRKGAIAVYSVPKRQDNKSYTAELTASLLQTLDHVHGKETVTALRWFPSSSGSSNGQIISVGRDGCCAIHSTNLSTSSTSLVHHLALPFGSNIEGLYHHYNHLMVYGFSSTRFVLYDTTTEEEIMSVDAGGAHRSWAFQPHTSEDGGGTLVWTRASSMHVYTQHGSSHQIIRSGGHGREIKAVASCTLRSPNGSSRQLIATGAEDTDIKMFEYTNDGEFVCRRTLRKHTTGIQHLQWSDDGGYLFSSGGCEEFYAWRVRLLPDFLGVGVVCESVCKPESEHSDLRLTSFDLKRREDTGEGFVIAMVFSDSTIRVYDYMSSPNPTHRLVFTGNYTTCSLTGVSLLSPTSILTTGTSGHAVFWPILSSPPPQPSTTTLPPPPGRLTWTHQTRIHQSTSKVLTSLVLSEEHGKEETMIIFGGDDGSLSILTTATATATEKNKEAAPIDQTPELPNSSDNKPTHPPLTLTRAHASAITACILFSHQSRIFATTSGNDQWVRIWEIIYHRHRPSAPTSTPETATPAPVSGNEAPNPAHALHIARVQKIKTNVADVSSMTLLEAGPPDGGAASERNRGAVRVLICGVGMEVVRLDWEF